MDGSAYKCTTFLSEILKGRGLIDEFCINGRIILKWILQKQGGRVWCGLVCLRTVTSGLCKYGTNPSGSIKGMKFLE
jgi:hypothetical protein